jgi:preprotein translocase subunit SecD
MARKTARPGRTLVVFFVGMAVAYGLVALGGTWKPELGLDLQGGTRITLVAKGSPSAESLAEARNIIDQRVNGSGVTEAEVTTQSSNHVVVEIPGKSRRDLVDTVKRQAQLRFRMVACSSVTPGACGTGSTTPDNGSGVLNPSGAASGAASSAPSASPSPSSKNRAPFLMAGKKHDAKSGDKAAASSSASSSASPSASPSASGSPVPASDGGKLVDDPLKWMSSPDPASIQAFNAFQCPTSGNPPPVNDDPDKPLVTCDEDGVKYLLSAALIEGTQLTNASYGIPSNDVQYVVTLDFNSEGNATFADATGAIAGTGQQFAIVLDGTVISAPTASSRISGGAQISGNFTESSAKSLATSLKFGALPISFEKDPPVETVGPSLAGDQLSAGIQAGIAGLLLVMLYCLVYYRGLGLVVIASLLVAGALTYAMVLLLSKGAGFTLSLPGIAGLIVAVGITADSFIVFFERIRDEMRDGKSMRVAVESGWVRARNTCLAADSVSLLAAVVLYIFAAGVVKGFAFALGLSTIIDIAIFFWFTKPMVSWLARFAFFNRGHKLSGLDRENLGLERIPVGGRA